MSTTPVPRQSLIPAPTPRESAIEGADAAIGDLNVAQIITARDDANCPPIYLPYLAWERSVKVWDPAWPVAIQRAVVAAAPEVNRYIGSAYAVKTALAALGVTATVTEWWQAAPQGVPYTFQVKALVTAPLYPGAPILDARMTKIVFSTVLRTKPVSRAFDLIVAADLPATLGFAAVAVAKTKVAAAMAPANSREVDASLGLAPVALARAKVSVGMAPGNSREIDATLGLAPIIVGRVRVAAAMTL